MIWDDIQSLVRKTESCEYVDQPSSLDLIGQLESGSLHWHKKLKLDVLSDLTEFEFTITQDSIIRAYIVPQTDLVFTINLVKNQIPTQSLQSVNVQDMSQGLHTKLSPGNYILQIIYSSEFTMPSKTSCPTFEMDLDIKPYDDYKQLASKFTCTGPANLPTVFDGKTSILGNSYMHNSEPLHHTVEILIPKNTLFEARVAFENILSGYISMEIMDNDAVIAQSIGTENFSELIVDLPKGRYKLHIISSHGNELQGACWPLQISVKTADSQSKSSCIGAILPRSLTSSDLTTFGGPQAKDGTISFHGVFSVGKDSDSEVIKIYMPEESIIRVLTVSNSKNVMVESAVYYDFDFINPVEDIYHKNGYGSYMSLVEGRKEPYYLMIAYTKEQARNKCYTFGLKIVIETMEKVGSFLECKTRNHRLEDLLPKNSLDFKNTKFAYGADTYIILDK